ncbi:sugar phosphate nucleotidyltransferase [Streptomyces europaeiscabiei]|nr:sugar phosphate nucleotidyltransferase [Streptomyces europaeiscabiei]
MHLPTTGDITLHAIILAGGRGSRLGPLTAGMPKPLLRLGHFSILEITLLRLRACGFSRVTLCVSYLGDMIRRNFGDGGRLGLSIDYCWDRTPLGTAAPLLLVPEWDTPALVLNGDVLTSLDFSSVMASHRRNGGLMTVATHQSEVPVDFGVLDITDGRVRGIQEKPRIPIDVAAGIQVIDPAVRDYLPDDGQLDMPTLVAALITEGQEVFAHSFNEPWHDIGTPSSYEAARMAFLVDPARYVPSDLPGTDAEAAPREVADA